MNLYSEEGILVEDSFWECPVCRFRASTEEVKQRRPSDVSRYCPRCDTPFYKFHRKIWKHTVFSEVR